ncbi:acyl-CoA dehydrogenase [Wenjunlia vitaminophila]|uniref:Acyl-CoA dehydrogenase n=1 Tax=Wenjunlia vitaminophila TaxID=76728 RepID=A0A0T6LNC7_WENVI|nr:acyl-CoA dehydrogenase family protein [Wenjunlia vitaminophila]KRV47611.1 acyl-CoA dehydrogenase [Wenjunlia vitaminophila]
MSDALLTEAHKALRDQVRAFAETEIAPRVAAMEDSPTSFDHELAALIARQGWIAATVDSAYGGMSAGHLAKTIIIEELSRVSGAMGAMVQASQLGVAKIVHYGTEEQKRTWLPQVADGTCLPTIAVTEPESGSHVLGMQSTAHRSGNDYILNGRKAFVGNSHIGHLHGVVVRTGPGSRGLTAFLVESDRPGVQLEPYQPTMGLRGFSFGDITFTNCRVPASNMIGDIGDGLSVAYSSSVLYGRLNLAAVALGLHQAVLEQTVGFASTRRRYGKPLSLLSPVGHKIGEMHARLMTARLTTYHASQLLDAGQPCDPHLLNAKYLNYESARTSAGAAMEIHAAAGLRTNLPVERLNRDVQHIWAPAGTGDVQLHRLAEFALGTSPGQQWSQRLADKLAPADGPWSPHRTPVLAHYQRC